MEVIHYLLAVTIWKTVHVSCVLIHDTSSVDAYFNHYVVLVKTDQYYEMYFNQYSRFKNYFLINLNH